MKSSLVPRPQFTLRALLVLMLAVGCFFGGWAVGQRQERMRLAADREWLDEQEDAVEFQAGRNLKWQIQLEKEQRNLAARYADSDERLPTSQAPE
jgi:hypothetical protein